MRRTDRIRSTAEAFERTADERKSSVNPLTVIASVASCDHNVDRALTQTAVVVGGLLRVAHVFIVQLERGAVLHFSEAVFLINSNTVNHLHCAVVLIAARSSDDCLCQCDYV